MMAAQPAFRKCGCSSCHCKAKFQIRNARLRTKRREKCIGTFCDRWPSLCANVSFIFCRTNNGVNTLAERLWAECSVNPHVHPSFLRETTLGKQTPNHSEAVKPLRTTIMNPAILLYQPQSALGNFFTFCRGRTGVLDDLENGQWTFDNDTDHGCISDSKTTL